jgi:serine/tyrosine/threonine adenylyltransferase
LDVVGFIHGVMNTDNTALSGETIDFGPCAFMESYDPATAFSTIDEFGRYSYGNQPTIAKWNLARFAETLLPLLDPNSRAGGRTCERGDLRVYVALSGALGCRHAR